MPQLKTTLSLVAVTVALFPYKILHAASGVTGPSAGLQNPIKFDSLAEFFVAFLKIIVQIGFPLVALAVVYSGFLFIKAQGNPEGLEKAKYTFFWTIIGALVVLGAAAIAELVGNTVTQILK